MAKRTAPVPNPTRRLALAARSSWNDPMDGDDDPSLDTPDPEIPQDEEELGSGAERVSPGTGLKRIPVSVNLTSVELKALADEFSTEIELQYGAQSNLRRDIQRWLRLYRARPEWDRKNYPLEGAPLARDTEVLTRQGWRRVDSLSVGDVVLTRRDHDQRLEWAPVEATPSVYAESLYWFKSETIDQQVTPEHTMVCNIWYRPDTLRIPAKDAWNRTNLKVPLTGKWVGEKPELLYGLPAEDVMALIGWYVTEGWCNKQNGKRVGSLFIGQCRKANQKKCDEIEGLLARLGIRWAYSGGVGTSRAYTLHARSMPAELADLLRTLGDRASDKHLPDFVFDLDVGLLRHLYDAMVKGDGWRSGTGREIFFSTSKTLADQFQILCQLLGQRGIVHRREMAGEMGGQINGRAIVAATDSYVVNVATISQAKLDRAKYGIIPYNDYAFCVTVRNHAIYVRRDGIPSWTGNSNVVVALAAIYTDQVDARLMQAIFQPEPHWIVRELNKKLADTCKPYERYLDWIRENMWNQREVVFDFVQDLTRLGTAIIYDDFVRESVRRYDDVRRETVEESVRSGPRPRWVAREDMIVPIGFSSIQLAPYVAHRNWFSWDQLERLQFDGTIQNIEELADHSDDEDDLKLERRKTKDHMATGADDSRFGVWSPYYVWFRRDLDRDGYPEEYVMLLHVQTRTILRLVANPSPSGTRPYVHSRFIKVNGEFDGIGIPEQVEQLQDECSTIHNQRRDRSHLANIVMYKKKMTAQSIPDTIRPQSGLVLTMQDPATDLIPFDISNPVQLEAYEEDFVRRLASERVGMSDIDMSRMSSPMGRAAATTVMALMQEGARRFDLNVSQVRAALTEQGHQITELLQIYGLPGPDEVGSPEQILDEKEAALVRGLLSNEASLRGYVAIQLNVATAAVNREVEKQSNMQLYGVIQGYMNTVAGQVAPVILNPQTPPPLKEMLLHGVKGLDKILEKLFQSHNQFDLETVLAGELLEQMSVQVQQNPQMGVQSPPGAEGPGQPALPPPQGGGGRPQIPSGSLE